MIIKHRRCNGSKELFHLRNDEFTDLQLQREMCLYLIQFSCKVPTESTIFSQLLQKASIES